MGKGESLKFVEVSPPFAAASSRRRFICRRFICRRLYRRRLTCRRFT
jgi:hypothetical protein